MPIMIWYKKRSQFWNWLSLSSKNHSNILQLLVIPSRILVPPVTQLFRSKWLHSFISVYDGTAFLIPVLRTSPSSVVSCSDHFLKNCCSLSSNTWKCQLENISVAVSYLWFWEKSLHKAISYLLFWKLSFPRNCQLYLVLIFILSAWKTLKNIAVSCLVE